MDNLENKPVQVIGPRSISKEAEASLLAGEGYAFTLHDDDGALYYTGRSLQNSTFDPLDDYGQPNAGCTEIRYNGKTL